MEFDKIREQKKEVIKDISEKVLEMTLEIKELEAEIEKIKKEWRLNQVMKEQNFNMAY